MVCGAALGEPIDHPSEKLSAGNILGKNQKSTEAFPFIKMKRRVIILNLVYKKRLSGFSSTGSDAHENHLSFEIISAYGGSIFQHDERGFIALFGLPKTYEDLPQRALRAAYELIASSKNYKSPGADNALPGCSILMDADLVTISALQEDMTYQFLEQEKIIEKFDALQSSLPAHKWVLIEAALPLLKGTSPALSFEALQVHDGWWEVSHFNPIHAGDHEILPNLNLEKNLASLKTLGDLLLAGIGRTAVLIGESGVGKSSLIRAWQAHFENQPSAEAVRWVKLSACPYRKNLSHRLTAELLAALVGLDYAEGRDGLPAQLLENLTRLKACPEDLDLQSLLDYLSASHTGNLTVATAPGENNDKKLTALLLRTLELLAEENPLVIVIDNLQHADAHSNAILAELCAETSLAPILVCLITRPDFQSEGWQLINRLESRLGNQLVRIKLERLSLNETETLITEALKTDLNTTAVANIIYSLAEGNPLFTSKFTKKLNDNGKIIQTGDAWVFEGELGIEDMPESVCIKMSAEFDRLPPNAQQIYKVACIFWEDLPRSDIKGCAE